MPRKSAQERSGDSTAIAAKPHELTFSEPERRRAEGGGFRDGHCYGFVGLICSSGGEANSLNRPGIAGG